MPAGRPKGSTAAKKKATETPILVDTLTEEITEAPVKAPREKKPGPKKVLDETGKAIGDAAAVGLVVALSGPRGIQFEEAQSITHPLVRIAGRRVPAYLKKFAPKTKLSPEDAADVEEMAVTIGKYALRLVMLTIQDIVLSKEKKVAQAQQDGVTHNAPATPAPVPSQNMGTPVEDFINEDNQVRVGTMVPHNPVFNVIGSFNGAEPM